MKWIGLSLLLLLLSCICMLVGYTAITPEDILSLTRGVDDSNRNVWIVITEARLPMALTAVSAGAALSISGALMQTLFRNPLAGPSILGVSSGASLGVAICAMAFPAAGIMVQMGAIIGAVAVILILLGLSSVIKNGLALLIAGIMISYLASSGISFLNYFAPATDVKAFAVWGMGSYMSTDLQGSITLLVTTVTLIALSFLFTRPLDSFLLGERYAANSGYSVNMMRTLILTLAGLLTASVTSFCGPIAFIGLTVPHLARMLFGTSRHALLLPGCILIGANLSLLCAIFTVIPSASGLLPINAVTALVGVPVIMYLLLARNRISYLNA